jgi:group II intron reverse transcriptase/maturase
MGRLFNQITSLDNLFQAWDEVAENKGAPGIDGVTLEEFARHWEANLIELRQDVRANRYRPDRLQRFTIPKRDGSPRLLGNLTVRDKVLQRAVLRVLDDIYERYFLDCSFAYRQGRSVQQAVERVVQARDFGRVWVLDADIDDFFHSLDHHLLMRFLRETIDDGPLLRLIVLWLNEGCPDPDWAAGTPLGAIISPLLSNIYLHYLDLVMTDTLPRFESADCNPHSSSRQDCAQSLDWVYVRYADDFIVLCRSQAQAELALQVVQETVETLLLDLEPTKTSITTFDQGFEYLGCTFKGDHFYFEWQEQRIEVSDDRGWNLFYQYGPEGYE